MQAKQHPGLKVSDYQIEHDHAEDTRPVIGVVVALWSPEMSQADAQTMHDLVLTTMATIRDVGGRPVIIDASDQEQQAAGTAWHKGIDALVYLGGADVHPGFFTNIDFSEQLRGIDVNADQFCVDSLREAVTVDAPVLGICRGAQLLNVALGGSIIQHIDGHRSELGDGETGFIDEDVDLFGNAMIARILGRTSVGVRSSHHQTIDKVGQGLDVTAHAQDGSIEAIEAPEKSWVVGLQWHPEEVDANAEDRRKIFQALVAQAQ